MSKKKKSRILYKIGLTFRRIVTLGNTDSSEHLDRSLLLEETGTPILMRRILYTFMFFMVLFFIWASSMKISEVAVCEGEVIPKGSLKEIQHLEGGIVKDIHVKEGVSIKAGTLLVELDDRDVVSQLSEEKVGIDSIVARLGRLDSFLDEKGNLKIELGENGEGKDNLNSEQTSILKQSIATLAATREVVESQIDQLDVEIEELKIEELTLKSQVEITHSELDIHIANGNLNIAKLHEEKEALQEELDIRETLVDKGYNSSVKFLNTQRTFFQLEKEIIEKKSQFEEKRHLLKMTLSDLNSTFQKTPLMIKKKRVKIEELRKALKKEEAKIKETIYLEKDTLGEEKKTLEESSSRLKGIIARKKIYAPVDGVILKLELQQGSVLAPGSMILSMVPDGVKLIAEINISNHDIGHIGLEDVVKLKFKTYDFSRYGGLEGNLLEISPFTLKKKGDPTQQEGYYRGIVEVPKNYLGAVEGVNSIFPGMTLQAEIVTGEKTVMEYLLKPIYASAQSAMHER